jgi:hypothetical protein
MEQGVDFIVERAKEIGLDLTEFLEWAVASKARDGNELLSGEEIYGAVSKLIAVNQKSGKLAMSMIDAMNYMSATGFGAFSPEDMEEIEKFRRELNN